MPLRLSRRQLSQTQDSDDSVSISTDSAQSSTEQEEEEEDDSDLGYSSENHHERLLQLEHDRQGLINSNVRHGFAEAYASEEFIEALEKNYFMYWTHVRHTSLGLPHTPSDDPADQKIDWRNRDRVRTAAAVLVVCLRIGYDPPDVIKTDPCAKLECWIDPILTKDKPMERIGKNLQTQFEALAATPKTRYKQYLDPPSDDAKKFCTSARKTAKNERVLFYYNGHGVPKPTASGELWLFNKQYTQYIPVSLAEFVVWLGSPTIMVWDCSAAGNIVTKVQEFGIKRDADLERESTSPTPPVAPSSTSGQAGTDTPPLDPRSQIPSVPFRETIQLGACLGHETLPMNPDLPADLFTCCLTTPVDIALRFFLLRNPFNRKDLTLDMLFRIPGKNNERRTPLGELTWIFTAVTDTIAWNMLPRDLFQKLFRHDLVVAALFRGFLLAERIMRFYKCTPISVPALPQTHNHPLWDSWDLAVDMCLAQLPTLLEYDQRWRDTLPPQPPPLPDQPPLPLPSCPALPYEHSSFFAEQLTAFEIWLEQGSTVTNRTHPEQLPVVLQVLLSQAHRLRALVLLCRFLDLGPWAVNVSLSIGIFAYVLRLLQAPAAELKPVLIYIWARILAVYDSCKDDLLKQTYAPTRSVDQAPYTYFVNILLPTPPNQPHPIPNISEHRAMCAFILSVCCRDFKPGQAACLRSQVFEACLAHMHDPDPHLRQWAALCIAMIWDDFDEAKGLAVRLRVHELFCDTLHNDPEPEVRTAVLYALGTLLGATGSPSEEKQFGRSIACSGPASGLTPEEQTDLELGVAMSTLRCSSDGSPPVRRELVVLLSSVVNEHQGQFIIAAYKAILERSARATEPNATWAESRGSTLAASLQQAAETDEGPANPTFQAAMFSCIFKTLCDLMSDPVPDIAARAGVVMDYIMQVLFSSPLGPAARVALDGETHARSDPPPVAGTVLRTEQIHQESRSAMSTPPPVLSAGPAIKRTASFAGAIKSLAQLTSSVLHPEASTPSPPPLYGLHSHLPPASLSNRLGSSGRNSRAPSPTPAGANGSSSPLDTATSSDSLRFLQNRVAAATRPPLTSANSLSRISAKLNATNTPTDSATISTIMAALVAGDEDRLRMRRATPSVAGAGTPGQALPLKGTAFDFFLGYYQNTQMRQMLEGLQPGSIRHNQETWRRARNEAIITSTQPMKGPASRVPWDEPLGSYFNQTVPTRIAFHQFEPHLLAADDQGDITVYEWEKNQRLNRFSNGSGPGTPITSLQFVNEDDIGLVLTATADGHVRIFRDYESPSDVQLVTAFRGISETLATRTTKETTQDAGLVLEWQQGRGQLLMGGNVKFIRVWDATKEMVVQELPTRANSCITALTCDQVVGDIIVAGFGDGGLRVYDRRLQPRDNMVRSYRGYHGEWLVSVHMQRGGNRELLSGSVGGEVNLWDIRLTEPVRTIQAHQGGMRRMAVHEHAPIFATSSVSNVVKVWNINSEGSEPLSSFRHGSGFLNTKVAPMTSMTFHPHHMILGCASSDGHINTFQMENYRDSMAAVTASLTPLVFPTPKTPPRPHHGRDPMFSSHL